MYFNKKYDVEHDILWKNYARVFNKNSKHFHEEFWPEWLNLSLEQFSIDRTIQRWSIKEYGEVKNNMSIILGEVNFDHEEGNNANVWIKGIKVNTKFE